RHPDREPEIRDLPDRPVGGRAVRSAHRPERDEEPRRPSRVGGGAGRPAPGAGAPARGDGRSAVARAFRAHRKPTLLRPLSGVARLRLATRELLQTFWL